MLKAEKVAQVEMRAGVATNEVTKRKRISKEHAEKKGKRTAKRTHNPTFERPFIVNVFLYWGQIFVSMDCRPDPGQGCSLGTCRPREGEDLEGVEGQEGRADGRYAATRGRHS